MNLDHATDAICAVFGDAEPRQVEEIRAKLAELFAQHESAQPPRLGDVQRALVTAMLIVEAEFATRCANCADDMCGGLTRAQWAERAEAYRAAGDVLNTQAEGRASRTLPRIVGGTIGEQP